MSGQTAKGHAGEGQDPQEVYPEMVDYVPVCIVHTVTDCVEAECTHVAPPGTYKSTPLLYGAFLKHLLLQLILTMP